MEGLKLYTEEQDDFIRMNWRGMSDKEMGEAIGRTELGVSNRRRRMKLTRPPRVDNPWSEAQEAFVVDNYKLMSDVEMGERLGRTSEAVATRRYLFGLRRLMKPTDTHIKWSEGNAVKSARDYVLSLGSIPKYEAVMALQLRIIEATTCLMNLHANAAPDRAWPKADQLMNAKLQAAIVESKQEQAWVYALPGFESEAA